MYVFDSVRKREPTPRAFTLDLTALKESFMKKKAAALGKKTSTSKVREQNSGSGTPSSVTTPSNHLSSQLPGSRVTRSQLAVSSGSGRKDAKKTAASDKNSNSASCQNSAASAASDSAARVRRSAKSKAGSSSARADSRKRGNSVGTSTSRKDASRSAVSILQSNSHSVSYANSASNVSSNDAAGRATHSAKSLKSQQEILASETNSRETRSNSVTVLSHASDPARSVETAGTGRQALRHRATGYSSVSTRSGKNSGVNFGGNRVPDHSGDNSIRFLRVVGAVTRSNAVARNVSVVVDRQSSAVAVTQQLSAKPSSSEAMAFERAADTSGGVTSMANMAVMTSGKKTVSKRSNAVSARTQSVAQSGQTASAAGATGTQLR